MKYITVSLAILLGLVASMNMSGQSATHSVDAHVAAAKAAAGQDFMGLFDTLCPAPAPVPAAGPRPPVQRVGPPDRSLWHADPVKVFDNLYFVGQTEYSAWAVTTSDGIIVIDTIWDYSVKDEVADGLTKLGFDPHTIKYAIVSHGHIDHAGGAKYLQDEFGTHVIVSAADWNLLERDTGSWPKPRRDLVATHGEKLKLGDTTLTLYLTPGHTAGTVSTLIPVKDHGTPHLAIDSGGTAFNWLRNRAAYISPGHPDEYWFKTYIASVERMKKIATEEHADVLISNHTIFDGSKQKLPAVLRRKAGDPNPYVIGTAGVLRYFAVEEECAKAGLLRIQQKGRGRSVAAGN